MVRASIVDIIRGDEVQNLIDEGILNEDSDVYGVQELAEEILRHKCNPRCLRRIGDGEGPENFVCRKPNNLKISPDNTKHCHIPISGLYSPDLIKKLIEIGMAEPIVFNERGEPSEFKSYHLFFHPTRHIPPTNPHNDMNISPVEGKTFAACRSMQNIQCLTFSDGFIKYICKYIGKIDENNMMLIRAHAHDKGILISQETFLHNTKISTSAINEMKALQKSRGKKHPKGRSISLMEMWQVMLGYSQVHTDMVFVSVTTLPLEQRAGVESKSNKEFGDDIPEDGCELLPSSYVVRDAKHFPPWRQHRDKELLILQGHFKVSISVDKITRFSVRPPELRSMIMNVGNYYRWFFIGEKHNHEYLETALTDSVESSIWVDGLSNQVYLRSKAIQELNDYLDSEGFVEDGSDSRIVMRNFMKTIISLHGIFCEDREFDNEDDHEMWNFIQENLLFDDEHRNLPIPVFSYVKPTLGPRFILHILLSMGQFETEIDLILHQSLRESLRYAHLIGPLDDEQSLRKYSQELLKRFIEEQLMFFPKQYECTESMDFDCWRFI